MKKYCNLQYAAALFSEHRLKITNIIENYNKLCREILEMRPFPEIYIEYDSCGIREGEYYNAYYNHVDDNIAISLGIIKFLSTPSIMFVIGHELGHRQLKHARLNDPQMRFFKNKKLYFDWKLAHAQEYAADKFSSDLCEKVLKYSREDMVGVLKLFINERGCPTHPSSKARIERIIS